MCPAPRGVLFLYVYSMKFEYDPEKSERNKAKHWLDFEEAKALFDDENAVEYRSRYP